MKSYFEGGYLSTPLYLLENLQGGHVIPGPAIIIDKLSTVVIEPYCTAHITTEGDIKIIIGSGEYLSKSSPLLPNIQCFSRLRNFV